MRELGIAVMFLVVSIGILTYWIYKLVILMQYFTQQPISVRIDKLVVNSLINAKEQEK